MSENWDEYAEGWNENPDVIAYSKQAYESLLNVKDITDLSVLDFGCGTGLLTEKIATDAESVVAIDPSKKMTQVLLNKNIKNVSVINAEVSAPFIADHPNLKASFDVIVASSVCAFLPNFSETLNHLIALLKPGGIFVQWDWAPSKSEPDFGFSPTVLKKLYNKANLLVLKAENVFSMSDEPGQMQVVMGIGKR
jgi:2-polyprenyl-3-methyl-5-hydroxy-6-metoxy-1,4-benzoquinol methylase